MTGRGDVSEVWRGLRRDWGRLWGREDPCDWWRVCRWLQCWASLQSPGGRRSGLACQVTLNVNLCVTCRPRQPPVNTGINNVIKYKHLQHHQHYHLTIHFVLENKNYLFGINFSIKPLYPWEELQHIHSSSWSFYKLYQDNKSKKQNKTFRNWNFLPSIIHCISAFCVF